MEKAGELEETAKRAAKTGEKFIGCKAVKRN